MTSNFPSYDVTELPSKFKCYPENSKISITPQAFGEVFSVLRAPEIGIGLMDKILEGVKCSFNKDNLLPEDIIYLGSLRKLVSTKHTQIEVHAECPMCSKKNIYKKDIRDIVFPDLEVPKFPIKGTFSFGTYHFQPITYKNYKWVAEKKKNDASWILTKCVSAIQTEESLIDLKKESTTREELNAQEAYYEEIRQNVMSAIDEDKEILDKIASYLTFGQPILELVCQDEFCKHEMKISMEDKHILCQPFREDRKSIEDSIKFGD